MAEDKLRDNGLQQIKKRVGFIGLSSPAAYLYGFKKYVPSNQWNWNAILESPQGLSVMYDEVWFLHEALCPFTMRNFTFVKYIESLNETVLDKILSILFAKNTDNELLNFVDVKTPSDFSFYNSHIELIFGEEPHFNNPIDNHTHSFDIHNVQMVADSQRPESILLDLMIVDELQKGYPDYNIDLITNKFTTPRLMYESSELLERNLAQDLLINGSSNIPYIPVLQNELGPDLKYIEKLRGANSFIDFREKLLKEINNENTSKYDIEKIASDIRQEFNKYESDTLYLPESKLRTTWTVSSILITALSFLIPGGNLIRGGVNTSNTLIKGYDGYVKAKNSWTSFITAINREKRLMEESNQINATKQRHS